MSFARYPDYKDSGVEWLTDRILSMIEGLTA